MKKNTAALVDQLLGESNEDFQFSDEESKEVFRRIYQELDRLVVEVPQRSWISRKVDKIRQILREPKG